MLAWEKIEHTARLMGYTPLHWVAPTQPRDTGYFLVQVPGKQAAVAWNPLDDTEDAFALAVELRLFRGYAHLLSETLSRFGNTPVATRQGIVEAALSFATRQAVEA
jgi:hypothetical protein